MAGAICGPWQGSLGQPCVCGCVFTHGLTLAVFSPDQHQILQPRVCSQLTGSVTLRTRAQSFWLLATHLGLGQSRILMF